MDEQEGWADSGGERQTDVGTSGETKFRACSRDMVAWWEDSKQKFQLMYGKRLEGREDNRQVKTVAEKLKDARDVGWQGEYGVLQRKYATTEEDKGRKEWKAKAEEGNHQHWWEEVESMSSLGW